jgi:hypothetical protein
MVLHTHTGDHWLESRVGQVYDIFEPWGNTLKGSTKFQIILDSSKLREVSGLGFRSHPKVFGVDQEVSRVNGNYVICLNMLIR